MEVYLLLWNDMIALYLMLEGYILIIFYFSN